MINIFNHLAGKYLFKVKEIPEPCVESVTTSIPGLGILLLTLNGFQTLFGVSIVDRGQKNSRWTDVCYFSRNPGF